MNVNVSIDLDNDLLERIKEGYSHDSYFINIKQAIDRGKQMRNFVKEDNLLYLNTHPRRLCIPSTDNIRSEIIRLFHNELIAGHLGINKTYQNISR